jgi:hypothetical protein
MGGSWTYYAVYTEELTQEDRVALDRPGFKLYPDGDSGIRARDSRATVGRDPERLTAAFQRRSATV